MRVLARLTRADERASLASPRAHVTSARLRPSSSSSSSSSFQSSSAREARPNRSVRCTSPNPTQSPRSFSKVSVSVEGGVTRVYIHNPGVMTRQTVPPSDRHRPRLVPVGRSTHSCRVHVRAVHFVFIHSSTAIPRRRTEGDAGEIVDRTRGRTVETWRRPAAAARRRWRTG